MDNERGRMPEIWGFWDVVLEKDGVNKLDRKDVLLEERQLMKRIIKMKKDELDMCYVEMGWWRKWLKGEQKD